MITTMILIIMHIKTLLMPITYYYVIYIILLFILMPTVVTLHKNVVLGIDTLAEFLYVMGRIENKKRFV